MKGKEGFLKKEVELKNRWNRGKCGFDNILIFKNTTIGLSNPWWTGKFVCLVMSKYYIKVVMNLTSRPLNKIITVIFLSFLNY